MEASLGELAALRAKTYGFYGSLFLPPSRERLSELAAAADELRNGSDLAGTFPFFRSMEGVLDALAELDAGSRRELEGRHVRLFVAGGPHQSCPPYESEYIDPGRRAHGSVAVELERVYAQAGFGLSTSGIGELPDHVSLELEFMSLLCAEEQQQWESAQRLKAVDCLIGQRSFLDKHLARWFPAFARCLGQVDGQRGFYGRLSEAVHAFIVHDRDLIETLRKSRLQPETGELLPER